MQCIIYTLHVCLQDVQSEVLSYQVNYNGTTTNVNSSTTTLTFIAPSLPDDEFSGTVVVMVTAVNRFGSGPASDPAATQINSMHSYSNTLI